VVDLKLYTKINQTQKSIEILSTLLKKDGEIDFNIVNMICELYMKVASHIATLIIPIGREIRRMHEFH